MPFLEVDGASIDYRLDGGDGDRPPLVFLHEGLGSIELWRDFPQRVSAAAGRPPTLVYSRPGYGRSSPRPRPWPVTYMHHEAHDVLPAVLDRLGLRRPVLVGHSDGGSIALLHAGAGHPVGGLVLMAPHVFVEARSVEGIEAAARSYREGDLRARLTRYHADVDGVFWGWNDVWLSPPFRHWDITSCLRGVDAPVLAVQGADDEYGTQAQLDAIAAGVRGPYRGAVVPHAGHVLHGGASDVADLVAGFVAGLG